MKEQLIASTNLNCRVKWGWMSVQKSIQIGVVGIIRYMTLISILYAPDDISLHLFVELSKM